MQEFSEYINNYLLKWRPYIKKNDYIKEFGFITDQDIALHNMRSREHHELVIDSNFRINNLKLIKHNNLGEEDNEFIKTLYDKLKNLSEKDFIYIVKN